MKKGFGWFFIVLGVLNIVRGFGTHSFNEGLGNGLIVFAVCFIILGFWMVSSSKSKTKNNAVD